MPRMLSLEMATQQIMNHCADAAVDRYAKAVSPIYAATISGTPLHIGSSFALKLQGRLHLLTAAHVLDNNEKSTLYIACGGKLRVLEGEFEGTEKVKGKRCDDHYDFAWCDISDTDLSSHLIAHYVEGDEISGQPLGDSRRFQTVLGFPVSKNKKYNASRSSVSTQCMNYSALSCVAPKSCDGGVLSTGTHIFIQYDHKRSKDESGIPINAIAPKGLSGGLVVDTGFIGSIECYRPDFEPIIRPSGLLIENRKRNGVLVATRLDLIRRQIKG